MSVIFSQTLFTARQNMPADVTEQRAAALLIAALCAPERLVAELAAMTDAFCPPEQPIAQIILTAADWLVDQTGPYGDLPFAAPLVPNLRAYLAGEGLAPHLCAAIDYTYGAIKGRAKPSEGFHADPQDLHAATDAVLQLIIQR